MRPQVTIRSVALVLATAALVAVVLVYRGSGNNDPLTVRVERGSFSVTLTESGALRPAESLTYRTRVPGRETEIMWLAPEGSTASAGDPLVRLDPTEIEAELARAIQAVRQAQLDLKLAEAEHQVAGANASALAGERAALEGDEARFALQMLELKAARLKKDYESLAPLLEKGFITRDELDRLAAERQQAEGEVTLARRRVAILAEQTVPQGRQRAALDLAHRNSQVEAAKQRLAEASSREALLRGQVDACTLRATRPGLVVHEDNLSASPVRKIRVGDRVTPSQGLVTIPEVSRMLVDTSLREADLHRVQAGQSAVVSLDAFPGARLTGKVITVGTIARVSPTRPFDGKRFDVVVALDPGGLNLRPEMTARVEIRLAEVKNALVIPMTAVFGRAGQRVVYVSTGSTIETRPVTLGQSDSVRVEVLSGLHEGEWIRLTDEAPSHKRP